MKVLAIIAAILFLLVSTLLMSNKSNTENEHQQAQANSQPQYNPAIDAVVSQKK